MEVPDLNDLLSKVVKVNHVVSAYIVSRAGNYISGNTPRMADKAMYAAITSLMYGTAEQIGTEMNNDLRYVSLNLTDNRLIVVGAGSIHIMGVQLDGSADPDKVFNDIKSLLPPY